MTYMYTTPRVPGGSARAIAGKDRSTRRFGTALVASLAGAFLLSAAIAGAANAQEDRFFSVEHSNTAQVAGSGGVPGATITAYDAETGAEIDAKFNTKFDAESDTNVCKRISRPWAHTKKK